MSKSVLNILLADHHSEDRERVKSLLTEDARYQFVIEECSSAQLALEKMRFKPYDCVLIDYDMPDQNGLWIISEIRLENLTLPVVMLTGNGNERLAVKAIKAGAQDYISKVDLNRQELLESLEFAIHKKKEELEFLAMATRDPLTHLPTRRSFLDTLDSAIARTNRMGRQLALLFIDINDFKSVNQLYGYLSGDQVLIDAAQRIQSCLRDCDMVARLGGDEFVVLLEEVGSNLNGCAAVANRIVRALDQTPYEINAETIQIEAAVGIALYPSSASSREELIQLASKALSDTKKIDGQDYGFAQLSL